MDASYNTKGVETEISTSGRRRGRHLGELCFFLIRCTFLQHSCHQFQRVQVNNLILKKTWNYFSREVVNNLKSKLHIVFKNKNKTERKRKGRNGNREQQSCAATPYAVLLSSCVRWLCWPPLSPKTWPSARTGLVRLQPSLQETMSFTTQISINTVGPEDSFFLNR